MDNAANIQTARTVTLVVGTAKGMVEVCAVSIQAALTVQQEESFVIHTVETTIVAIQDVQIKLIVVRCVLHMEEVSAANLLHILHSERLSQAGTNKMTSIIVGAVFWLLNSQKEPNLKKRKHCVLAELDRLIP